MISFLEFVHLTCSEHNIKLLLDGKQYFRIGTTRLKTLAFFDAPGTNKDFGVLGVALHCKSRDWVELLVHEFGHVNQWLENAEVWCSAVETQIRYQKAISRGRITSLRNKIRWYRAIQAMELDCERRAAQMITTWKLPVDLDSYIQQANFHIWSHTLLIEAISSASEVNERALGIESRLAKICPTEFLDDYSTVPEIMRGLIKHKRNITQIQASPR